jgi:hypothetical protein
MLIAFLLSLWCHKLVSDCMAHGQQFSREIQFLKLPHFWKVAGTTAIWHCCLADVLSRGWVDA